MSHPRPHHPKPAPAESEPSEADLFDYAKIRDHLGFVLRSARRRWVLALCTFASVVGLTALSLKVLPKTYHCQIKIQAQRNQVISTLVGFNRQYDWDLPTRAASDLVMRHDNLLSLVRKTDLIAAWHQHRAPALRFRDRLAAMVPGRKPPTREDDEEMLAVVLEDRLRVTTGEGTVAIEVDWDDARSAYRLIQSAYENFLEARQFEETSAVSEAIGLLEARAASSRERVNQGVERLQGLRASSGRKSGKVVQLARAPRPQPLAVPAPSPAASADPTVPTKEELSRLREQIRSKQQAILDMDEYRKRRITDLESKLAELRHIYNDAHPAVVDLEDNIQALRRQSSPQLAGLVQELEKLQEEYARGGGEVAALEKPGRTSAPLPVEAIRLGQAVGDEVESPAVEQAKNELRYELSRLSALNEKVDGAKLERDTQRAAFRYRYGVFRPPAFPTSPLKPKAGFVLGAGVIAGLLLALVAAALADLRSGLVLEAWQVERRLGLHILAEVRGR